MAKSFTPNYGLGMWDDHDNPGAAELNNNWLLIDTMLDNMVDTRGTDAGKDEQTLNGSLRILNELLVDNINENTADAGVTIEGILLKDNRITGLLNPVENDEAVTKQYVDNLVQGLDWQESVLSKDLTTPPANPNTGDRYLLYNEPDAGTAWEGHKNEIAEWNGTSWSFYIPNKGWTVMTDDEQIFYTYAGVMWVFMANLISHEHLADLMGGETDNHYHLTEQQRDDLLSLTFDKLYDKEPGVERVINVDDKPVIWKSKNLDDLTSDFEFFKIIMPWTGEPDRGIRFIASPDETVKIDIGILGIQGIIIDGLLQSITTYGSDNWFSFGEESIFTNYLTIGQNHGNGIFLNPSTWNGPAIGWATNYVVDIGLKKNGNLLNIIANGKTITVGGGYLGNETLFVPGILSSEDGHLTGFSKITDAYPNGDAFEISHVRLYWKKNLYQKIETIGDNLILTNIGLKIENTDYNYPKVLNADLSGGGLINLILDIADIESRQEGSLSDRFNIIKYDNPYPGGSGDLVIGHKLIHTGIYIDDPSFENELCKTKILGNNIYIDADASDTNYGLVYFKDKFLASFILLSETGVTGFDSWFTKNSLIGNINELAQKKWTIKRGIGAPASLNNDEIYIDETAGAERLYVNTPNGLKYCNLQ